MINKFSAMFEREKDINNFIEEITSECPITEYKKEYDCGFWNFNTTFKIVEHSLKAGELAKDNHGIIC